MAEITRDGATVRFEVHGDGPRTLVLAHNLFTDARIFEAQIPAWSKGSRVIAVDLRGHRGSAQISRPFSTRDLADDVVAILDALSLSRVVMVGVSLGASTALELAVRHPSRLVGMVLMGATSRAETTANALVNGALASTVARLGVPRFVAKQATTSLFGTTSRRERAGDVATWAHRLTEHRGASVAEAVRAWSGRRAILDHLANVEIPALVLTGDEDTPCPLDHGREIHRALPRSRFETVPRAGHTIPVEQPDVAKELVAAFVAELPR